MIDCYRISRWLHGRSAADRRALPAIDDLPKLSWPAVTPLPPDPPGWHVQARAVLLDGTLGILRANHDINALWQAWRAGKKRRDDFVLPPDCRCMLTSFNGHAETAPCIAPLTQPFPRFDRLAGGDWVVADNLGAVHYRPGRVLTRQPDGDYLAHHDPGTPMIFGPVAEGGNAALIRANSGDVVPLELGDHIIDLLADPDGGFWLSYGDTHYGGGGIVRHDAAGRRLWALNEAAKNARLPYCDHPYAMNVGRHGCWAYVYSDFLFARLDPPDKRYVWRPDFAFAEAMAIADPLVMMVAPENIRALRHHVILLDTTPSALPHRPTRRWIAALEVPDDVKLFEARDDTLHMVADNSWHRLSIAEADAQVPPGPWRA